MEGYGGYDWDAINDLQGREQAEDTRRWEATHALEVQRLDNAQRATDMQYKVAKLQAQTAREQIAVDRWKAEKDYEIQQERNRLDAQRVEIERYESETGRYEAETGRGAQGLDVLKTDVELRQQPRSWTALADWEAGVAQNPFAVDSLRKLVSNSPASPWSQQAAAVQHQGLPQANSLAATLSGLGAGQGAQAPGAAPGAAPGTAGSTPVVAGAAAPTAAGAPKPEPTPYKAGIDAIIKQYVPSDTPGWNDKDKNTLGAVAMLASMGEQKYANRYSQMDEMDQEILLGGMGRIGRDPARVQRQIERNRIGQGSARLA
jgi:hypothetical protein